MGSTGETRNLETAGRVSYIVLVIGADVALCDDVTTSQAKRFFAPPITLFCIFHRCTLTDGAYLGHVFQSQPPRTDSARHSTLSWMSTIAIGNELTSSYARSSSRQLFLLLFGCFSISNVTSTAKTMHILRT